jgi:alpha-L-arabinofuranosidase
VNTDQVHPLATTITVKGAKISSRAKVAFVKANAPQAFNSFSTPEAISIRRAEILAGEHFTTELPPGSVSVITLEVLR